MFGVGSQRNGSQLFPPGLSIFTEDHKCVQRFLPKEIGCYAIRGKVGGFLVHKNKIFYLCFLFKARKNQM